jgi:hypothetical protein
MEDEEELVDVKISRVSLRCPVCLQRLTRPVMSCQNGHSLCGGCASSIVASDASAARLRCPVCRDAREMSRNLMAEAALDGVVCECPNACGLVGVTASELEKHAQNCPMSPTVCGRVGCGWSGLRKDLADHEASCPHPDKTDLEAVTRRLEEIESRIDGLWNIPHAFSVSVAHPPVLASGGAFMTAAAPDRGLVRIELQPHPLRDGLTGIVASMTWSARPAVSKRALAIMEMGERSRRHAPCLLELDAEAAKAVGTTDVRWDELRFLRRTTVLFFERDQDAGATDYLGAGATTSPSRDRSRPQPRPRRRSREERANGRRRAAGRRSNVRRDGASGRRSNGCDAPGIQDSAPR